MKLQFNASPLLWTFDDLDTEPCETDSARPETHDQYKVIDPEGNEDWLCAYDVTVVEP